MSINKDAVLHIYVVWNAVRAVDLFQSRKGLMKEIQDIGDVGDQLRRDA